jgi:putative ABC transport system permease protein
MLILAESLALTAVGGTIGMAVAWLLVAAGDPTGGSLPVFFIPLRDLLIGLVLVVLLALIAGLLPAWQAGRLRVADALRR